METASSSSASSDTCPDSQPPPSGEVGLPQETLRLSMERQLLYSHQRLPTTQPAGSSSALADPSADS